MWDVTQRVVIPPLFDNYWMGTADPDWLKSISCDVMVNNKTGLEEEDGDLWISGWTLIGYYLGIALPVGRLAAFTLLDGGVGVWPFCITVCLFPSMSFHFFLPTFFPVPVWGGEWRSISVGAWLMAAVSPPQRARCGWEKHRLGALNGNILALRRDLLFLHSASEATLEELVTEVVGEILREAAGNVLSMERQRVQEERRRVEEERWGITLAVGQGGLETPQTT